ncbi:hypothetical protein DUI87_11186 [Hirundo rustica rustica]|uniref:ribonuclease H n=1 Tax=Hirundo rustica rustica TaxID=333673 RepID=A0A3M0KFR5_HIRRU|nr:hypothetical protein DUI87_11186 [Hirundo rustica rustica]
MDPGPRLAHCGDRQGPTGLVDKDLKDAFFCLPIHEDSQKIFAFEWENPKSGCKSQLTWSVLPQGFKNSPTLFGEQLAKDLESWEAPQEEGKLLQYMDDILIATWTKEACVAWTVSLLNFLGLQGYRVSKKKAQVVKQKPNENIWVTLAKTLQQDNLCLSMGSIDNQLSTCLVGVPLAADEYSYTDKNPNPVDTWDEWTLPQAPEDLQELKLLGSSKTYYCIQFQYQPGPELLRIFKVRILKEGLIQQKKARGRAVDLVAGWS